MLRKMPMRGNPRLAGFAAVLALVVALGAIVAQPVEANGKNTSNVDTSDVFGEPLASFLSHYPNARQVGVGTYELEPGARLVLEGAAPSDVGILEAPSGCPGQRFCFYAGVNFTGAHLEWSQCLWEVLPTGLRNEVSSMHNTQNSHTAFWADTGPNPDVRDALGPNDWHSDLRNETAPDGGTWNNRIDTIDPTNRC